MIIIYHYQRPGMPSYVDWDEAEDMRLFDALEEQIVNGEIVTILDVIRDSDWLEGEITSRVSQWAHMLSGA